MPFFYLAIWFLTLPILLALFVITFLFPDEDNID